MKRNTEFQNFKREGIQEGSRGGTTAENLPLRAKKGPLRSSKGPITRATPTTTNARQAESVHDGTPAILLLVSDHHINHNNGVSNICWRGTQALLHARAERKGEFFFCFAGVETGILAPRRQQRQIFPQGEVKRGMY